MSEVQMCTIHPEKEAAYAFEWAWGEKGFCSHEAAAELKQLSKNLNREVLITPIQPIVPPLMREERTRLIAEKLSAESERDDTQARAANLYESNLKQAEEINTLRTKLAHLEAVEKGLRGELAEARTECTRLSKELGKTGLELNHQKQLLAANPAQDFEQLQKALTDSNHALNTTRVREAELAEDLERTRTECTRLSKELGKTGLELNHQKQLLAANPAQDFEQLQKALTDSNHALNTTRVREAELAEDLERTRNDAASKVAELQQQLDIANGKLAEAGIS